MHPPGSDIAPSRFLLGSILDWTPQKREPETYRARAHLSLKARSQGREGSELERGEKMGGHLRALLAALASSERLRKPLWRGMYPTSHCPGVSKRFHPHFQRAVHKSASGGLRCRTPSSTTCDGGETLPLCAPCSMQRPWQQGSRDPAPCPLPPLASKGWCCQLIVVGAHSKPTGIPDSGCGKEENFIQRKRGILEIGPCALEKYVYSAALG